MVYNHGIEKFQYMNQLEEEKRAMKFLLEHKVEMEAKISNPAQKEEG